MTESIVAIVGGIVGVILAVGGVITVVKALSKQGTVQAALDTVELLKAQVESLEARVKELTTENGRLTATVEVLRDQVTQAAPVKELAAWARERAERQHTEHEENLSAIARLEGGISRIETHLMGVK